MARSINFSQVKKNRNGMDESGAMAGDTRFSLVRNGPGGPQFVERPLYGPSLGHSDFPPPNTPLVGPQSYGSGPYGNGPYGAAPGSYGPGGPYSVPEAFGGPPPAQWQGGAGWYDGPQAPQPTRPGPLTGADALQAFTAAAYRGAPILDPEAYASLYAYATGREPSAPPAPEPAPSPAPAASSAAPAAAEPGPSGPENPVLRMLGLFDR